MLKEIPGFDATHGPQKGVRAEAEPKKRRWTVWTAQGNEFVFTDIIPYALYMSKHRKGA